MNWEAVEAEMAVRGEGSRWGSRVDLPEFIEITERKERRGKYTPKRVYPSTKDNELAGLRDGAFCIIGGPANILWKL